MFQETTPEILSVAKVCLLLWRFDFFENETFTFKAPLKTFQKHFKLT